MKDVRDGLCVTPGEACHAAPGGFDVIIGNPPYIRIQALKEWAPLEVEFYKQRFRSASKGNYDIYVVFVEKGLSLLNHDGRLGFILPHKFFNAQYGQPLRTVLSEGRHLAKVVHFGDQQVFENATTYTSLMFLKKDGQEKFEFEKVDDLKAWRTGMPGVQGDLPTACVTPSEWNFAVGKGAGLFYKLSQMPIKLGDVAYKIFQGLVTGADQVFILTNVKDGIYYSEAIGKECCIESELMHGLCKGSVNIKRYHITALEKSILFPYKIINNHAILLSIDEFTDKYPLAWRYLLQNRQRLEARESGKWKHQRWYAFGRSQNLCEMEQIKILTPSIAKESSFTLDISDSLYFVGSGGGGGGGYGITLKEMYQSDYLFILGLLNSRLLEYYLKKISSIFRGGYYAYNRQYIEQLPIVSKSLGSTEVHSISSLVDRMLALHQKVAITNTPTDKTLIQRQINANEAQIDALVYELYGMTDDEIKVVEGR